MKQSFAFVRLGFSCICLPMGSRSIVWMMELLYAAPWLLFSFQQKVSGQQIYQECLKNFEMIFLDLLFTSMLQGKIKFKDVKSMDPKMIAIILFHHFFRREIFFNKEFFSIYCSPNFYYFSITQIRLRYNYTNHKHRGIFGKYSW